MKRPLRSIYGHAVATVDDFRLLAEQGYLAGLWGNQMAFADPQHYVNFDDFDGASLSSKWGVAKGSDGGAANFAIAAGICGTAQSTTGAGAGATMAVNGVQISSQLNLKASAGGLSFNARIQLSAITNVALFVGFTNQIAALQMPINGSGAANGLTNNANDAVGILFDTTMANPVYWLVGAKGGVGAIAQQLTSAPVAATYDQFAISVDTSGNANFFQNGAQVGVTMANAITPSVAITPVVAAFARAAASRNVVLDYLYSSIKRV